MLAKSFGCVRWFYNYALNLTSVTYKATGKGLSRNDIITFLPSLKKEHQWLAEPPSQCLQQVALDLSSAFLNFFEKRTQYPNFKRIGKVYCKVSRLPEGKLKSVTVSMTLSGEYYAACLYDDGKDKPALTSVGKAIGIDMGINHYAITSNGTKHSNPKYYCKYEVKLAKKQTQLTRKQKESNNRKKSRFKVTKVYTKITRCREHFLHKLSRKLVDENQIIVVENLAVRNMVKNRKLALSISDAGWGQFFTMLKYKAEWQGKVYINVDRFFPSSKTCSNCLNQIDNLS